MRTNTKRHMILPLVLLVLGGPAWAQEDILEAALTAQAEADQAAVASQERIDQIHDETQALVTRYRQALADTDSMKRYNEQLAAQVASQTKTVADMRTQLAEIENTHREVLPLMEKM